MLRTTRCPLHTSSSKLFLTDKTCQNVNLAKGLTSYATGEIPAYQNLVHWRNYEDTIRILTTPQVTENRTFEQRLFNPIGFSRFVLNPMYLNQTEKGFMRTAKKYVDIRNYIRIPGLKVRLLESTFYNRRQRILKGRIRDFLPVETLNVLPRAATIKYALTNTKVAQTKISAQLRHGAILTAKAFTRAGKKKHEVHGYYQRPTVQFFNTDRYLNRKAQVSETSLKELTTLSRAFNRYAQMTARTLVQLTHNSLRTTDFKTAELIQTIKQNFPVLAYRLCTAEVPTVPYTCTAHAAMRYVSATVRLRRKRNINTEFKSWWVRLQYKSIFDKVMQYTETDNVRVTQSQRWQQRQKQYLLRRFQFRRYVQRERRKYRLKRSRYSAAYTPTRKALAQMHNYRFFARRTQPSFGKRRSAISRAQKQRREARVRVTRWVERRPSTLFTRIQAKATNSWVTSLQQTGQQLAARACVYTY